MKMKRFVAAAAALLIMVSMIGSGFSYWYFQTSTSTKADQGLTSNGKEVTQLVAIGKVTAASNFKIVFDQTADGRKKATNPSGASGVSLGDKDKTEGIHIVYVDDQETAAIYTKPASGVDHIDNTFGYTYTVTMTMPTALANYLTIDASSTDFTLATSTSESNTIYTFTYTSGKATTDSVSFDWDKITIGYKENKEPTEVSAYNTFKGIVDNASITVKYDVTIASTT